jgi:hydrogenase maturation protease
MIMQATRTVIAGIGDIRMGDDGFGSQLARQMIEEIVLPGVGVVDFGLRGRDLAYCLLEDFDLVVLVEAFARGETPGTLRVMEPDLLSLEASAAGEEANDANAMRSERILREAASMGAKFGRVVIIGCEPTPASAESEMETELSQPVREAVGEAIGVIESCVSGEGLAVAAR